MSKLRDLAHRCAVTVGKADNMRCSASAVAVEISNYLRTDDGIEDAIACGVSSPTMECVFLELIVTDTAYPADVFGSFSSFRRLLLIAGDPERDKQVRAQQKATRANAPSSKPGVSNVISGRSQNLQQTSPAVVGINIDPVELATPNEIIRAWLDYPEQRAEFLEWRASNEEESF